MSVFDELADSILAAAAQQCPLQPATVVSVTPGAAKDGNALVTVNYKGRELKASYGAHYTPAVGHAVLVALTQPLSIIQRLIGTP